MPGPIAEWEGGPAGKTMDQDFGFLCRLTLPYSEVSMNDLSEAAFCAENVNSYNPSASGISTIRSGLVWAGMLMVTN